MKFAYTQAAMVQDKVINKAVRMATTKLGYASLKDKQIQVITEFASGRDDFAALPTGYGKSLCYDCLPRVFDKLQSTKGSIVVVVSPLSALMKKKTGYFCCISNVGL